MASTILSLVIAIGGETLTYLHILYIYIYIYIYIEYVRITSGLYDNSSHIDPKNSRDIEEVCSNPTKESIRTFTDEFKKQYDRLDIVCNNAGVMGFLAFFFGEFLKKSWIFCCGLKQQTLFLLLMLDSWLHRGCI